MRHDWLNVLTTSTTPDPVNSSTGVTSLYDPARSRTSPQGTVTTGYDLQPRLGASPRAHGSCS